MADPVTGGRYIRDRKTGALAKADEKQPAPEQPIDKIATELTDPETEVAPAATAKKGK
ncbi:hypothetical protein [Brucella pseudogrignonensis]|uniref:hypothetical protein n=1 Tax=Brucella pseudogrignonensis TaxID=419475 RepID=UPI003ECE3754